MRRGYLYSKAKELGCNKIALGHHYDDVIETILMGMLYGAQVQTMMPKLHSTNFEGMELIRPMYLIREDDIKHWRDYNGLHFIQCACKFTDTCTTCNPDGVTKSKRMETKQLIAKMKEILSLIHIQMCIRDSPHNDHYPGNVKDHCYYERDLKFGMRAFLQTEEAAQIKEHVAAYDSVEELTSYIRSCLLYTSIERKLL